MKKSIHPRRGGKEGGQRHDDPVIHAAYGRGALPELFHRGHALFVSRV
jgi:hypothetical protein